MSAPICGWAFNTGRSRKLSPSERLVLWALAEHCNGKRADLTCWPSIDLLEEDTGLTRPTVIGAIRTLATHALIAVAKRGRGHQYTLLAVKIPHQSPVKNQHHPKVSGGKDGASVNASPGKESTPVTGSPPVKKDHATGKECPPGAVKNPHSNLLKEPLKEPVAREEARSGAASGPEPGREDSSGGSGAPPPPPVPGPPKAPTIGATIGRSDTYRPPGAPQPSDDDFNDFLDAPSPAKALPCEIAQEIVHADPLDLPVDPEHVRTVIAELRHELRMRAYPPRAATMSRDDQADAVIEKPRPKTYHLNANLLAAARKQAGIRATVDA